MSNRHASRRIDLTIGILRRNKLEPACVRWQVEDSLNKQISLYTAGDDPPHTRDCDFLGKKAGDRIGHYTDSFVCSGLVSLSLIRSFSIL